MTDRIVQALFVVAIVAIPFDAVAGLSAAGELSGEASFYLFLPAILLMLARLAGAMLGPAWRPTRPSTLGLVAIGIAVVVLASALANLPTILSADFHGRSGFNKLITSNIVLIYGMLLAWLAARLLPTRWQTHLIKPIAISAVICLGFSALEWLNRMGLPVPFYDALNKLVHSGSDNVLQAWDGSVNLKLIEGWDKRLRSVSFEPPAFGNFTGYAWAWLLCGVLASTGGKRVRYALLLGAFTILILASQARTGQLLLASNLLVFLAIRFVFAPPDGHSRTRLALALKVVGGVGLAIAAVLLATRIDTMTEAVVAGDSVSDLSRLAYQTSAFSMFASSPLFGVGMGQFAFRAIEFMPNWAYFSPEVAASMIQPSAPWPNTYSLYARLSAETGLFGLIGWLFLWIWLMVSLLRDGNAYARRFGAMPVPIYPLVMNCVAVLVSAITTDTFRTPMIWIALGGSVAVLSAIRAKMADKRAARKPAASPRLARWNLTR